MCGGSFSGEQAYQGMERNGMGYGEVYTGPYASAMPNGMVAAPGVMAMMSAPGYQPVYHGGYVVQGAFPQQASWPATAQRPPWQYAPQAPPQPYKPRPTPAARNGPPESEALRPSKQPRL